MPRPATRTLPRARGEVAVRAEAAPEGLPPAALDPEGWVPEPEAEGAPVDEGPPETVGVKTTGQHRSVKQETTHHRH